MLRVRQRTRPPSSVCNQSSIDQSNDLVISPTVSTPLPSSSAPPSAPPPPPPPPLHPSPSSASPFTSFSSSRLNFYVLLSALFSAQLFLSSTPSTTAAPWHSSLSSSSSSSFFSSSSRTRRSTTTTGLNNGTRITKVGSGPKNNEVTLNRGKVVILNDEASRIRLYGTGLSNEYSVKLDSQSEKRGTICKHLIKSEAFPLVDADEDGLWADVVILLPTAQTTSENFYLCLGKNGSSSLEHQGFAFDVVIQFRNRYLLPVGLQIFFLVILLFMSGMFSGLNLGLMSLDKTELQILINVGTEQEKIYAKKIQPIRNRGNYLLCTVLFSNVLVNAALTVLFDGLTGGGGVIAIIGSTMGIVIFGEIIPQAVCSRHGLAVGAGTIWIMKFFMVITFPLSFPISMLLDKVLGEEIGNVYSRDRLRELLKITASLHDMKGDEIKMISGALSLTEKSVLEVMTNLEDVFAVPIEASLDFETMSDIVKRGFTRIPIYEGEIRNIVGLLNIRDLAFVDPDDAVPLKTLCKFYQHSILSVHDDTKLDTMLNEFKEGQCHMALVETVNNSGGGDPFYEVLGLVTLEDVIEEIIQAEIVDESDVVIDNRKQILRTMPGRGMPLPEDFVDGNENTSKAHRITPQLSMAVFQFLSAQVEPFGEMHLTPNILRRLIKKSEVIVDLKHTDAKPVFLYEKDKPTDFFCFILEGSVQCCVGKDELVYETGSFSSFGAQALLEVLQREESLRASRNSAAAAEAAASAAKAATAAAAATGLAANTAALTAPSPSTHRRASSFSNALKARRPVYYPDFTVKTTAPTQILKVTRSHYLAARRASELEMTRSKIGVTDFDESIEKAFNDEWKKSTTSQGIGGNVTTPALTPDVIGGVANNAFIGDDAVQMAPVSNGTAGGGGGGGRNDNVPLITVQDAEKNARLI